jgi:hypothetical protein
MCGSMFIYFLTLVYPPLTETVVVAEALNLSLYAAIVMHWFSVSRALNIADISDGFCRWSLYGPRSSRNGVQIHDQII